MLCGRLYTYFSGITRGSMKIHISTLGCKVNQYESQAVASMLRERGCEISDSADGCDVIIVNTCAVTVEAVRKSRQAIRNLSAKSPGALTVICGCWPQTEPDNARSFGADIVFGSGDKHELVEAVLSRRREVNIDRAFSRKVFEPLPSGSAENRTRALMKIEDGCVNFCSYCVIPYARGRVRSLPVEAAAEEARRLKCAGYMEIVLTGIEIASYGADLNGRPGLVDVAESIIKAAPGVRLRLGSLEPTIITGKFCERLSKYPELCDHFHLSLQSGCDETLKRMNRKYDTARFFESVELLRSYFPNCGITSDLITGFPGETEAEFGRTLEFIKKCNFSQMHVFPYSRRAGTPADSMPDQITRAEKERRAKLASLAAAEMKRRFAASQAGKVLSVLFETVKEPGVFEGHSGTYLLVSAKGEALRNRVCDVLIKGADGALLFGDIIDRQ